MCKLNRSGRWAGLDMRGGGAASHAWRLIAYPFPPSFVPVREGGSADLHGPPFDGVHSLSVVHEHAFTPPSFVPRSKRPQANATIGAATADIYTDGRAHRDGAGIPPSRAGTPFGESAGTDTTHVGCLRSCVQIPGQSGGADRGSRIR